MDGLRRGKGVAGEEEERRERVRQEEEQGHVIPAPTFLVFVSFLSLSLSLSLSPFRSLHLFSVFSFPITRLSSGVGSNYENGI